MKLDSDRAVRERYSSAAQASEEALCCPVEYDPQFLKVIPAEVIERDYGCGDPSQYLKEGETVLDLGSGTGKICFIASQVVGPKGKVIGVDMNDEMLDLARASAPKVAEEIGFSNVEFRKGKIQNLRLDRDHLEGYLREHEIRDESAFRELESWMASRQSERPMIEDGSIDVVVSNCVLNLVSEVEKAELFREIFRVLKRGGRAVISDIVSDEKPTEKMKNDPKLWSGCISGAYTETGFLEAFEEAGFYGVQLLKRDQSPWKVEAGMEFRSVTVEAFKGKQGECWDHHEALVYKGPFKKVEDDDGHVFHRGERSAVCRKTYSLLSRAPYQNQFLGIEPYEKVLSKDAQPFQCAGARAVRDPRVTKQGEMPVKSSDESLGGCC